jgi:septation ring formation regulator EzrA
MDASVKSKLKALKHLLISSHDESKAYWQELQDINKECLVMKHKIDVLLHALEEVSRWPDNSTISSLASLVASIRTISSDELNESPPKTFNHGVHGR